MLYISDEHYFSFNAGLGTRTNNFAELCALKLLLTLARRNQLAKIQIFGDSQLVINWANGKFRLMNLELSMILHEINRLTYIFQQVDLKHIYRERNTHADVFTKAGASIVEGYCSIKEYRAFECWETFQIF